MTTVGLLFRFEARPGHDDEVTAFLHDDLAATMDGLAVGDWYAVQFGPSSFGVVATFGDTEGERSHPGDRIAAALREHLDDFAGPPSVEGFDVVAAKVPA